MRTTLLATAALAALAAPAAAVPIAADGDPILWWNQVYLDSLPFPTGFQRNSASFNIAMHDAVNAVLGKPHIAYIKKNVAPGGDLRAAAAQAAHDTLMVRAPAQAAVWTASLATQLALVPDGPAKDQGRATGATYAALILANRAGDGTGAPTPYTPSGLPGRWAPTPPAFAPATGAFLGNVTPWLATANDQFRPGAPPALDSAEYTAAFDEVKALGRATGSTRTTTQTEDALFWAGATSGARIFLRAGIEQAEANGLSEIENAALFARLHVALADATQQTFNAAFFHDIWRPATAIRAADTDGNPATLADPLWLSLAINPSFPSYPAIGVAISAATAGILEHQFGAAPVCGTFAMLTRCYASFDHATAASVDGTVWGGASFRYDADAGLALGEDVAAWTLAARPFGVPAPAGLALFGLGLAALAAGRRRIRADGRTQ